MSAFPDELQTGRVSPHAGGESGAALLERVARRKLVVSFSFAAIAIGMEIVYVLLNAFAGGLLSERIVPGSSVTVAIALGYLMILAMIALAGIYVFVTHRYVTPEMERLRREHELGNL